MKIPKFLTSSVDPNELGLTVKGFLTALIPVVLVLSGIAHVNVGQEQISQFIDALVNIVVASTTLISTVAIFVGIVRKILVAVGIVKVSA